MIRIDWPTIIANVSAEALAIDLLLAFAVMSFAKRLKRIEVKFIDVVSVRCDVVCDLREGYLAFPQTHGAQRIGLELVPCTPSPTLGVIQIERSISHDRSRSLYGHGLNSDCGNSSRSSSLVRAFDFIMRDST
jgi:hypothetical protein